VSGREFVRHGGFATGKQEKKTILKWFLGPRQNKDKRKKSKKLKKNQTQGTITGGRADPAKRQARYYKTLPRMRSDHQLPAKNGVDHEEGGGTKKAWREMAVKGGQMGAGGGSKIRDTENLWSQKRAGFRGDGGGNQNERG